MVQTPVSAHLSATIDDLLGPASGRFFGSGYRRIGQQVGEFSWDSAAGSLQATAGVRYPVDWSVKRTDRTLAPHLSTIDALVFAAQLSDAALTLRHGLDAAQRRSQWLRRVEIRAGSRPDEEGLDALPAKAQLRPAAGEPLLPGHALTLVDCRIGRMGVRCTVEHPAVPVADHAADTTGPDPLGPAEERVWGLGYQRHRQHLTDVGTDLRAPEPTATARMELSVAPGGPMDQGLEGGYRPGWSLVDSFVAALQLGQVLLYELDAVSRAESSTLWMRRTVLTADVPPAGLTGPVPVGVVLADPQLLDSRSARWRSADIRFRGAGTEVLCSVTHRLPEPSVPAAAR
jgi:hypothetical protein